MHVLSLFDGMSCGQIALERAGIKVDNYFASEIKKPAIKVTMANFPNTIQLGDVRNVRYENGVLHSDNGDFNVKIDLLIGGSPCQDFSTSNCLNMRKETGMVGLKGSKSGLFYEYLRIFKEIKPQYFLLENVKMKKEAEFELSCYLETTGIHINSRLVSYQNRPRIYWTNIPGVCVPKDRMISFQDFKDTEDLYCSQFAMKRTPCRERMWNNGEGRNKGCGCDNVTHSEKINCITRKQDRYPNSGLVAHKDFARYLTRRELELGQTVPIGYTDCVSYNRAQDLLGDGWTIDVICHLLKPLKETYKNL